MVFRKVYTYGPILLQIEDGQKNRLIEEKQINGLIDSGYEINRLIKCLIGDLIQNKVMINRLIKILNNNLFETLKIDQSNNRLINPLNNQLLEVFLYRLIA